jgi:hypothetical protein
MDFYECELCCIENLLQPTERDLGGVGRGGRDQPQDPLDLQHHNQVQRAYYLSPYP